MRVLPFRPVAFRLPLSAVAALAEATGRVADAQRTIRRRSRLLVRLAVGFRLHSGPETDRMATANSRP
jgi:hypothetical protein